MENALLIGLSRQASLKRQMSVIANNLANVNTAGFKTSTMLFEEHLMPVAEMGGMSAQDKQLSFVLDANQFNSFSEGAFKQTGNELDVAVSGDGWLAVQTPDGERYTRNGQMKLDAQGQLVSAAGYPVLGGGGPIAFGPQEMGVEIAKDGTISTSEGIKDQLRLVRFENMAALEKQGETLFRTDQPPLPAEDARVLQGVIEKSNVEPVMELTRMIETVRAYTSTAQSLSQMQDVRRDAIQKLGSTSGV